MVVMTGSSWVVTGSGVFFYKYFSKVIFDVQNL